MSKVIDAPSRSNGVMLPAVAEVPPIILPEPNCSKSMFAVAPDWSTYISLSAAFAIIGIMRTI